MVEFLIMGLQVSLLFLLVIMWWETGGKYGYRLRRATKRVYFNCDYCEDTGLAPNLRRVGGYPSTCLCASGECMEKRIMRTGRTIKSPQVCASCENTGLLSLPGVKTVACNCRRGSIYRTAAKMGCLL